MIPASSVKTNHIFCLGMSKSISVSIHSVIGPNADPQNPILAKSCCHQTESSPVTLTNRHKGARLIHQNKFTGEMENCQISRLGPACKNLIKWSRL